MGSLLNRIVFTEKVEFLETYRNEKDQYWLYLRGPTQIRNYDALEGQPWYGKLKNQNFIRRKS